MEEEEWIEVGCRKEGVCTYVYVCVVYVYVCEGVFMSTCACVRVYLRTYTFFFLFFLSNYFIFRFLSLYKTFMSKG